MKRILKIILTIIFIAIIVLCIGYGIYNNMKDRMNIITNANEEFTFENSMEIYEVTTATSEAYVKSSGTIISFNIQTLDIEEYEKVKDIYIQEGQYVDAKKRIMKVTGEGD